MSNKQTTAVSNIINRIDDLLLLNYDDSDEPKILELLKKYCISQLPIERKHIEDAYINGINNLSEINEKVLASDFFTSTFTDGE